MSLILRSTSGVERHLIPEGSHIARVDMVADLGTQSVVYKGETKHVVKVYIRFELPEEKLDDGRPSVIGKEYTHSFDMRSNARKDIQQMLGVTFPAGHHFDIFELIGKVVMVTVVHNKSSNGKTYANIGGYAPLHKSLKAPAAMNEPVIFDLDNYSEDAFLKLPEWLRAKVNRIGVAAKVAGDVDSGDGLEDL